MSPRDHSNATPIAMAIGFLVLLWIPLGGMFFSLGDSKSNIEKRVLEPAPNLADIQTKGLNAFCQQFNKFFNDRIVFRQWLITANNVFRFVLFRTSSSERVTIGKAGWLYYTGAVRDFRSPKSLSTKRLSEIQRILEERRNWLASQGIKYLFLVAPNKTTIYPEHLPDYVHRRSQESKLDQLQNHLEKNSDLPVLDLRPALRKTKITKQIYHRTDTHWNDEGALTAYRLIMAALTAITPTLSPVMKEFHSKTNFDQSGDLAHLLTLSSLASEDMVRLRPNGGFLAKKVPFESQKHKKAQAKEQANRNLPKLLVFGDSFVRGTRLKDFLAEHFQRSVFVRGTRDHFDVALVKSEKPDIVIQEIVERFLAVPFQDNSFDHAANNNHRASSALLSLDPTSRYQNLRPMRDATLTPHESWLLVTATGKDPHFQLPPFDFPSRQGIELEIILQSPTQTELQMFYLVQGETKYSEKFSMTKPIQKGRNTLHLSLIRNDLWGKLRLDPGRAPGEYRIHSIRVYAKDRAN